MSANNRRIRRIVVDLLWEHGESTKERMAKLLAQHKSVRNIPSPHSLSSILRKNTQVIVVGTEKVENDIDRYLVREKDDLIYTRSPTVMTPKQRKAAQKCSCGKLRVFPPYSPDMCLHCYREPEM
jgi:hypothetical protein